MFEERLGFLENPCSSISLKIRVRNPNKAPTSQYACHPSTNVQRTLKVTNKVLTSHCATRQPTDVQHTLEVPNRVLTSQCKSRLPTDFQHTINEMVTYRLSRVILEMNRPKNTQLPRVKEKQ